MKQLIERPHKPQVTDIPPHLLDRLEKLEAILSIAERMHEDWEAGLDGLAIRRDFEAARAALEEK